MNERRRLAMHEAYARPAPADAGGAASASGPPQNKGGLQQKKGGSR